MIRAILVAVLFSVTACASTPEAAAPPGPPDLALTPGLLAPPQARLYADCIAQAAETGSYNRERDGGTLRFTCTGGIAKAFYDSLGAWSAKAGSEYVDGDRTLRFTKKLIKDAYGVDFCAAGGGDYQCVIVLNTGQFIEQLDYPPPKL